MKDWKEKDHLTIIEFRDEDQTNTDSGNIIT